MSLYSRLKKNSQSDIYPFHMPGHKRNINKMDMPYQLDITEIDGFDDLHNEKGCLKDIQDTIKNMYNCSHGIMMVNGSTGGIFAAIYSVAKPGEKLIIARNSHKSAYNAVYTRNLNPAYIIPKMYDELGINKAVTPEQVEKALSENPDAKAVFITSPTYEGVISDISGIAQITHCYNIPLIVDCAHGAHFGLSDSMPANPVQQGADIVIMSWHKTLSSLNQCAVVCVNEGYADYNNVKKYTDMFETSSPSYVLMASMEETCIELQNDNLLRQYATRLGGFRNKCKKLQRLQIFSPGEEYDEGKLVICTHKTNISGKELYNILLNKYHLQMEMSSMEYVIAMTSYCDSDSGFDRLWNALTEIDNNLINFNKTSDFTMEISDMVMTPGSTEYGTTEVVELNKADGLVSAEYIYMYPPGIPWIVPGERITGDIIRRIYEYQEQGYNICGPEDNELRTIKVKIGI